MKRLIQLAFAFATRLLPRRINTRSANASPPLMLDVTVGPVEPSPVSDSSDRFWVVVASSLNDGANVCVPFHPQFSYVEACLEVARLRKRNPCICVYIVPARLVTRVDGVFWN